MSSNTKLTDFTVEECMSLSSGTESNTETELAGFTEEKMAKLYEDMEQIIRELNGAPYNGPRPPPDERLYAIYDIPMVYPPSESFSRCIKTRTPIVIAYPSFHDMRKRFVTPTEHRRHRILTTSPNPRLFGTTKEDGINEDLDRKILEEIQMNVLLHDNVHKTTSVVITDQQTKNMPTNPDCCFPTSQVVFMVVAFMTATLLILTICCFAIVVVRYVTKRNGQKMLKKYRESRERRERSEAPEDRKIGMLETQVRAMLDQRASQDVPVMRVEVEPKGIAGIVGFLAVNQVDDEEVEFRTPYAKAVMVSKSCQGVQQPDALPPSSFASSQVTSLPATHTLPETKPSTSPHLQRSAKGGKWKSKAEKKPKNDFLGKVRKWASNFTESKSADPDDAQTQNSSRRINRRVGWSDDDQRHQVIVEE
ncbi:hypothetical protein QR680_018358 [Steinernema hermaphroditum]|uniref:Uncharacterized protein n=1 Tax=Steinernema hermaphroditum TaxID=289476 RepID=A0AA39HII7_9BILA|nr:hypothetical protein QR680_018358 [Steinernema hermaphroditum]